MKLSNGTSGQNVEIDVKIERPNGNLQMERQNEIYEKNMSVESPNKKSELNFKLIMKIENSDGTNKFKIHIFND